MTDAAFFSNSPEAIERVYARSRREILEKECRLYPVAITSANLAEHLPALADLEVIFSTWGMFAPADEQLAQMPNLKAVFYAAGSVQGFARAFLERGVAVVSAWGANAVPVAEFTLAQILLANKGYFRNISDQRDDAKRKTAFVGKGNYGETVALLGAGMIGRKLIELLRHFHLRVIVFDPFLSEEQAALLGVEKVSLEDAFARGMVVSNHIANLPSTVGMLKREHFSRMRENAVFINTGRGETIIGEDLADVLESRPDLMSLIDVLSMAMPQANPRLQALQNVIISGHIAGSVHDEVLRMADYMIEEFGAWRAGKPLRYGVTLEMLKTMA